MITKLQNQITELKDELESQRQQLTEEKDETERQLKQKLTDLNRSSKQRVEQIQMALDKKKLDEKALRQRNEKMQEELDK